MCKHYCPWVTTGLLPAYEAEKHDIWYKAKISLSRLQVSGCLTLKAAQLPNMMMMMMMMGISKLKFVDVNTEILKM